MKMVWTWVFAHKDDIVETVFRQKVTLIVGGTGCGVSNKRTILWFKFLTAQRTFCEHSFFFCFLKSKKDGICFVNKRWWARGYIVVYCEKTTQIPLMLAKRMMKQNMAGRVLCTQPRRIPCIQISRRVGREVTEISSFYNFVQKPKAENKRFAKK